jgi:rhomboid protease GluP
MFKRQRTGSVVCASCGSLVGVNDEKCYMCGQRNPSLWGFAPMLRQFGNDLGFIPLVVYGCAVMYTVSLLLGARLGYNIIGGSIFSILSPGPGANRLGATGIYPVRGFGMWWTLLSASWLHGSAIHILFNMMAFRQLAPGIADLYGAARTIIIYIVSGVIGFIVSVYMPAVPLLGGGAGFTLGASASIVGLLGAAVYYGRRTGSAAVRSQAMGYVLPLIVMGLFLRGIDNYAHIGGFAGGYLMSAVLDPLKPERTNHMAIAVLLLFLSAVAILWTLYTYWSAGALFRLTSLGT